MTTGDIDRRRLLKAGGALSALGAAAPFAAQLIAAGSAAASVPGDYKALVCIYLYGANDPHNTVVATDTDSWTRYFAARNTGFDPIALMPPGTAPVPAGQISPVTGRVSGPNKPEFWGGVLPITPTTPKPMPPSTTASPARTFALHPFLGPLQSLFNQGRLAIVANVGPLIGMRTWGGLVGIYDYPNLMDGGSVTAPRVAFFNPESQWEVENHGTGPDIEVDWLPSEVRTKGDPQLLKAIEVVMQQLKEHPLPKPVVPAFPDYHR